MRQVNAEVTKKSPQETIESLLRRFKRKVKNSGVMDDIKKNEFFVKKSTAKREKIAKSRFKK